MFANKRDELSGFGQRIFDLMNAAGYPVVRDFAIKLLEQGLVTVNTRSKDPVKSRECAIDCVERKIVTHLNSANSNCLQGEFANAYHQFFGCSMDYLYGYTNVKTPSIEMQAICHYLGLSERAVYNLINGNTYRKGYPINAVLSNILEFDDSMQLIDDWGELNDQIYDIARLNIKIQKQQEMYSRHNSSPLINVHINTLDQLKREKSKADRINRGFVSDFAGLITKHMKDWVNAAISQAENQIRKAEHTNPSI